MRTAYALYSTLSDRSLRPSSSTRTQCLPFCPGLATTRCTCLRLYAGNAARPVGALGAHNALGLDFDGMAH